MPQVTQFTHLGVEHITEEEARIYEKRLEAIASGPEPETLEQMMAALEGMLAIFRDIETLNNQRKGA